MKTMMKNRTNNNIEYNEEDKINLFLYQTKLGRILLKLIYIPIISKISGLYFNLKISKLSIKKFIKKNNINMDEYEQKEYHNFNDFFTRNIIPEKRPINKDKNVLISPCDAKLTCYKISENNGFKIKNSIYTIEDLLQTKEYNQYKNGYVLIFRLAVDDYHHYCYIDDGTSDDIHRIKGKLHTVRPIALENYPVFVQNERTWQTLHTKHFNDIIQIEVGALMVGKIINLNKTKYQKGEEKGYFKFGASTIILLVNDINIDKDILNNTKNKIETIVKMGEQIGIKKDV